MLKSVYDFVGFFGALGLSIFLFLFLVFWMAGIAGIALPVDGGKAKYNKWLVVLAVFVPVYPVIWIIHDIVVQQKFMNSDKTIR
jgi:hypothetical protein